MAHREPSDTRNLDIDGHAALEWDRIRTALDAAPSDPDSTWFLVSPTRMAHRMRQA